MFYDIFGLGIKLAFEIRTAISFANQPNTIYNKNILGKRLTN